jgi:hypothetical protein
MLGLKFTYDGAAVGADRAHLSAVVENTIRST